MILPFIASNASFGMFLIGFAVYLVLGIERRLGGDKRNLKNYL